MSPFICLCKYLCVHVFILLSLPLYLPLPIPFILVSLYPSMTQMGPSIKNISGVVFRHQFWLCHGPAWWLQHYSVDFSGFMETVPSLSIVTSHIWLLNTWSMASMTVVLNSHMQLVTTGQHSFIFSEGILYLISIFTKDPYKVVLFGEISYKCVFCWFCNRMSSVFNICPQGSSLFL